MLKQIIWAPSAEKDLDGILEYLHNKWGASVAMHFVELANKIIEQLSLNPNQFPLVHKRKKVRKCVITKHNTLYYRARRSQIAILRIYDTRQDPDKLKF
jgi:plasmid stabilization system protein ParE